MLDKYVHEDDGYFSWDILGTYEFGDGPEPDVTVFVVNMTSQKWMDGQRIFYMQFSFLAVESHQLSYSRFKW